MATYYVRIDGNDSNAGTGSAANQAWQTIGKAIGATGISPGDTLYIAPGVYRGSFTAAFTSPSSEGQRITIAGNPTATLFSGVNPGPVIITNFTDNVTASGVVFICSTRSYISIQDISFVGYRLGGSPAFGTVVGFSGTYQQFRRCSFYGYTQSAESYPHAFAVSNGERGPLIEDCVFFGYVELVQSVNSGASYDSQSMIRNCVFINQNTSTLTNQCLRIDAGGTTQSFGGITVVNCRFIGNTGIRPRTSARVNATFPVLVQNCIFDTVSGIVSNALGDFVESYNIFNCSVERTLVATGTGSIARAFISPDFTMSRLSGWANLPFWANHFASASQNAGINTNSDTTDFYGVTWLAPSTPTMGPIEYFSNTATGAYFPTERNASTITIAPGSTSQSIELYLGATGLTASTSGLSARYNRTRTASVSIPLVARTIAQAWTAGGFAQVDATNMPGVYRLDIPDAALAAGADDVTVVVRGASGTNGAVMTVKLSSGGLTSAQTASAVWGALTNDHTTHGTFGWNVLRADQDSKEGLVTLHQSGGVSRVDADIHAIVNDTDAATELKGALLHNGTDYISADLLTPVSAATSVHIGPYQLLADGLGADQPLDVNVGTATSIDVQVTDANGTGIDITGATVSAKVYNSGGTLVATYNGTATYADNGRLSFGLTTTVTNTSGTYTVTVTRTTGASDTQVFGPLKLYVRPV
jgi:hypothetical protein